jgi:D-alanine-D-alanine ligase
MLFDHGPSLDERLDGRPVGIFAGGRSPEWRGSLVSADQLAAALAEQGIEADVVPLSGDDLPERLSRFSAAYITAYGWYGEDGKLQGLLEMLGVPYTGTGVMGSAIAMYKPLFKQLLRSAGLPVAPGTAIRDPDADAAAVFERLGERLFVKPSSGGASIASGIAETPGQLSELLRGGLAEHPEMLVEPYLEGRHVTVAVTKGPNGELTTLPPLEPRTDRSFYDRAAKLDPELREYHCPAPLNGWQRSTIIALAHRVYTLLRCEGFARVDFILGDDALHILEANTVPGMSRQGNLAAMGEAAGVSYGELVRWQLASAFERDGYLP